MAQFDQSAFDSLLVQSGAAIVGVLSAVLAAQLQQWLSQAAEQASRAAKALDSFWNRLALDTAPLEMFLANAPEQIRQLDAIPRSSSPTKFPKIFAPFTVNEPASVGNLEQQLSVDRSRLGQVQRLLPILRSARSFGTLASIDLMVKRLEPHAIKLEPEIAVRISELRNQGQLALLESRFSVLAGQFRFAVVLWLVLAAITVADIVWPTLLLAKQVPEPRIVMVGVLSFPRFVGQLC